LQGLDFIANAGSAKTGWYGILTDSKGIPLIQGPTDPNPGYYISPTSLKDPTKAVADPTRYVNSETEPYIAIPRNFPKDHNARLGDVALVYYNKTGQYCAAVVADIGPLGDSKAGEGSIALAKALGIPANPKKGGTDQGVTYVVFKNSNQGWPRANADIATQVSGFLDTYGPFDQYLK
jgi:hypothetical protein